MKFVQYLSPCLLLALAAQTGCDRKQEATQGETAAAQSAETRAEQAADTAQPTDAAQAAARHSPPPGQASGGYNIPQMSETELASALVQVCQQAQTAGRPLLLEFSAPWCGDCRRLAQMKTQEPLRSALAEQPQLTINIGQFDTHESLLEHYRVKAIAQWTLVEPNDCAQPASTWKIRSSRTLEPLSGKKVDAQELSHWLSEG